MLDAEMLQHARKTASIMAGRQVMEARGEEPRASAADAILAEKRASADPDLYKVAEKLVGAGDAADALYERMGGTFGGSDNKDR
jgi:hypothetical protein